MKPPEKNRGSCSVLLVDDEKTILVSLRDSLREAGAEVLTATTGDQALHILCERTFDVVVSDVRMPGLSGLQLLQKLRESSSETPVILMTAYATVEQAVEAMRMGAYDYVTKPFPNEKVVRMVENAWSLVSLKAEIRTLRERSGAAAELDFLVGRSPRWQEVLDKVTTVATTDSTVLIIGGSGTGKEMIAKALHLVSRRNKGPFIKVHCAALPPALIENELFGHEAGAYTGAGRRLKGRFESANGGTLLLDEVDEIPLNVQVKLLRVIQERVVDRLGGTKPVPVDVRLLATSKGRLEALVERGTFRDDLFYRLSVVQLHLPQLAERRDDIPLLLEHFRRLFSKRMMHQCCEFTPETVELLINYDYPGNVRELEHIVESACALSNDGPVTPQMLPERVRRTAKRPPAFRVGFQGRPLQDVVDEFERSYLEYALREFEGTRSELAEHLGISRKNLWQKLKRHRLERA